MSCLLDQVFVDFWRPFGRGGTGIVLFGIVLE